MVARHFYRNDDGDMEEVELVPTEGWETKEGAEEGQSETSTIAIPDPELELDFLPYRRWIVYEDESESDDQVLYSGFVSLDDTGRENGGLFEANGRVINLTVVDMNSLFDMRVLVGDDTDRPDETDVERVEWVVATEEMGYFDDLSLISSDDPADLDERDVAGQTPKQIFDEGAQDASKNYWISATGNVTDGTDIFVWYGKDSLPDYASPLSLSNDPGDWDDDDLADGTSLVWPISEGTQRHRTGERIYSGVLVEYENGRKYRRRPATMARFTLSGRDLVHSAPEIKTEARAGRRADRLLDDLDTPEETITTTVRLPAAKATMLRAGMLVPSIKATHIEGWEVGRACRILNASVKPVQAGAFYDITIEAVPVSTSTSCSILGYDADDGNAVSAVVTNTASGFYTYNSSYGTDGDNVTPTPSGLVFYPSSGSAGRHQRPAMNYTSGVGGPGGGWSFRTYGTAFAGSPTGFGDGGAGIANWDKLWIWVIGSGTAGIWLKATGTYDSAYVEVYGVTIPTADDPGDDVYTLIDTVTVTFPTTTVSIPDDGYCAHVMRVYDLSNDGIATGLIYGGFDWTAD